MTTTIIRFALISAMLAPLLAAAEPATTPASDRGLIHTTFTDQDPRSPVEVQRKNPRIIIEKDAHYDLKDESFEVYVPADYEPAKAYGLFVWINAGNRGSPPAGFTDLLDKQHLIYVAANNAGNERAIAIRFGLALDAVLNLKKTYNIDVSRIYSSGISGGAKVASMLAVIYPDTFCGTIPIVGVAYFRAIALENEPNKAWPPVYYPPAAPLLERAKTMGRFVLITGPNDMNHDSIIGTFKRGFTVDHFQHVDYIEVPGMGHQLPPIEQLEAAIEKLDEPLPSLMGKTFQLAEQARRARHFEEARPLYLSILLHGDKKAVEQATKSLALLAAAPTTKPR